MQIEAWHWVVLGAVLAIAEMFAPGTLLIWSGGAALVLGLVLWALPPVGFQWQLLAFIVLAPAFVMIGLTLRRRRGAPVSHGDVNLGSSRLVGQHVTLATPIVNGRGHITLGDTVWQVTGPDLPAGTVARISGSDGATLTIAALKSKG